jgi:membrane-associated phospholipid phosphatase
MAVIGYRYIFSAIKMKIRNPIALLTLLFVSFVANASSSDDWEIFSDVGAYGLVGTALVLPAYKDDWEGFRQAGYSVVTASAVGLVGKTLIDAERPDDSGNDSFPSNHTSVAYAAATTLNLRYGWEIGFPAYGMATLVGIGRVKSNKHYWKDVIAGAVIGSLAGWAFTDALDDSIQILPWAGIKEAGVVVLLNW